MLTNFRIRFKISKDDIIPNIFNFIVTIAYSLFYVIIKYINKEFYLSIFLIYLIVTILSIIIEFLIFIIYSLIEFHELNYFKDVLIFSNVQSTGLIITSYIFGFLFRTISQVLLLLTIIYFHHFFS